MHHNKKAGGHQRKGRHRLRKAVNRLPPVGVNDVQDSGEQRPGMAHADPEDERRDIQTPHMRVIEVRNTQTLAPLVHFAADANRKQAGSEREQQPERQARFCKTSENVAIDLRPRDVVADIFFFAFCEIRHAYVSPTEVFLTAKLWCRAPVRGT